MVYLKVQAVPNFMKRTVSRWAKRSLTRASTVLTDGMRSFNAIGEVVEDHQSILMEGCWRNSRHPAFEQVNTILGNLKGNILGVCRWISAKHLSRYLAEFQWRFNRRFDMEGILNRLLRAAVLIPPMPQRHLVLAENGRSSGPLMINALALP